MYSITQTPSVNTPLRSKYQLSSATLTQLQDEGFPIDLIQPDCMPTFDELVKQLLTTAESRVDFLGPLGRILSIFITDKEYYDWLSRVKKYALTYTTIDNRLFSIVEDPFNRGYVGCGITQVIWSCEKTKQQNAGVFSDKIHAIFADLIEITSFKASTLGRLNESINEVELIKCDIMSQGRDISKQQSNLTEDVGHIMRSITNQDQRLTAKYDELKTQLTNHIWVLDVVSANMDEHLKSEEVLRLKLNQLQFTYLQLENRVLKMETIQQIDIANLETYITNIHKRFDRMDTIAEQQKEQFNSNMISFETKIKHLETNLADLNQTNRGFFVVLLILINVFIISYVTY